MSRLLAVELRRFRSRRLLWILAALTAMAIAYAGGIAFWNERFDLVDLPEAFTAAFGPLMLVALILGASFIGAEWHAGTVTTLLTWEPRRGRVIAAKLLATLASVFVLSVATLALLGVVLALDAAARGTTAGADGAWLAETLGMGLRVTFLACFAAAVGFGLATIGRNTAGALGAFFGYLVIFESLIQGLEHRLAPWLVSQNIAWFIATEPADVTGAGRSVWGAALYLLAVAALVVLVAVAAFRTRDVT
jgi:ABC-type transport system involved in multi-copper enzyme maturation permease subunit